MFNEAYSLVKVGGKAYPELAEIGALVSADTSETALSALLSGRNMKIFCKHTKVHVLRMNHC